MVAGAQHTPSSSASSAIDLTQSTAGLSAKTIPPSPSLSVPSPDAPGADLAFNSSLSSPTTQATITRGNSTARRRLSRTRNELVHPGQDPLRLDLSMSNTGAPSQQDQRQPGPSNLHSPHTYTIDDDPFYSPSSHGTTGQTLYLNSQPSYADLDNTRYGDAETEHELDGYSGSLAAPSTASLITNGFPHHDDDDDEDRHMTPMSSSLSQDWIPGQDKDVEREGRTPRSKRKTVRYSSTPSPLKRTSTALKGVSKNLQRMSTRVVNTAGMGLENQIRLDDEVKDPEPTTGGIDNVPDPHLKRKISKKVTPLRGRTLGFMKRDNKLRLTFYHLLQYPWTEPMILVLIIVDAIVLTIQASRSSTLSTSDGSVRPPSTKGYFHTWEDYALFALFVLFTFEAFARICVSGFLLDPEIPTSALFTSPLSSDPDLPTATLTSSSSSGPPPLQLTPSSSAVLNRQNSLHTPSTPLSRGLSLTQRIDKFNRNLAKPFALQNSVTQERARHIRSETTQSEKGLNWAQKRRTQIINPNVNLTNMHMREGSGQLLNGTYGYGGGAHYGFGAGYGHYAHLGSSDGAEKPLLAQTHAEPMALPFRLNVTEAHSKIQRNVPYLRHSWSRIDIIAITAFWITVILAETGVERGEGRHVGLFRAMSVLRTARLLSITSGTTTIMHSLKRARHLLTNVAYFVLFAMMMFSIVGIQSFKGSLRRICVLQPIHGEPAIPLDGQYCGGYIDSVSLNATGYVKLDGSNSPQSKGYVCPLGQICVQQSANPSSNVESFDTIYNAALQVIVVASANGWAPLMYNMIDAEFFASSIFFIVCILLLNFWLINLFVAVITNSFSAIRSETKKSAFGADLVKTNRLDDDDGWGEGRSSNGANLAARICDYLSWAWVLLALASLALQATRTVDNNTNQASTHELLLSWGELGITIAFDFEIVLRFLATLPDWRSFFGGGKNWLDLFLAVMCSVIQIPVIKDSDVYPWFTIFQLARFYRVILVVPRMKPLLLSVFGNVSGLANMTLFLILVNFLAALIGVQLLRGDMGDDVAMNFGQLFTAFLGVYQVFSSENWTDVLYAAAQAEADLGQTLVVALFVAGWMLFANFIMLQMFIAVINENFQVAEEAKEARQASHYWATHHQPVEDSKAAWMHKLNPYRWIKPKGPAPPVMNGNSGNGAAGDEILVEPRIRKEYTFNSAAATRGTKSRHYPNKSLSALQRLFTGDPKLYDVPMETIRHKRDSTFAFSTDPQEIEAEKNFELLASVNARERAIDLHSRAFQERIERKATFIQQHPTYDRTFWIFDQDSKARQFCQRLVQPASPPRIYGQPPSQFLHPLVQLLLLMAVVGGIIVEIIATPQYRRQYYAEFGQFRGTWFDIGEAAFGLTLLVEFLIKVVADGFIFTPNAYLRSIWNVFDFVVLMGLLVNITTGLIFIGGLSRLTRSLKALRVLRLITLIERMRETFESLIISGALRIVDAAILAILYMIPYAVWGLNIFAGKMNECNDTDVTGVGQCTNEYVNTVYGDSFGFYAPRVWSNPSPSTTFSFDTFRSSLLILFEIVSLEGWIDVMEVATSITGRGSQPQTNASQANAIFFLVYNLMGGIVILTLFVSIIISNFSSKTGSALLTKAQREWIDLQKLFRRQKPSKRPRVRPTSGFRSWCYDRAIQKHGWWARTMTVLILVHIVVLMTQTFSTQRVADTLRNDFFLVITALYLIDTSVRFYGLRWRSFRANWWNLFDAGIAFGSFITTIIVRFGRSDFLGQQLQKLFLACIAFKLVQRNDSLNVLFKTAVASLPTIASLLVLWLILFVFFGILFVEVFGMTKWGTAENRNQNYYTMGSALVMLAFMSTGEGWNQYMHDFALEYPRCTDNFGPLLDSDCGSVGWAFILFIAWNVLSMYIFVNLFTGVVVESFSFVFQSTSGGTVASVTREEMRSFKKVWAEFAHPLTGLIERPALVPFFGKLTGVFEVRIYPRQYSVRNLVQVCREDSTSDGWAQSLVVDGVDVRKLEGILSGLDREVIKRRRLIYNRLHQEALMYLRDYGGISFTKMLMMLANHTIIVEKEALTMKEFVDRMEVNKNVKRLVYVDRVRSCLKTIHLRRKFLAIRAQRLEQEAPSIIVETPDTPPRTTRDISTARFEPTASPLSSPRSSWRFPDITSPPQSFSFRSYHQHHPSDVSTLSSGDLGNHRTITYSRDPYDDSRPHDPHDPHEGSAVWIN